jgi:hypothetical protein
LQENNLQGCVGAESLRFQTSKRKERSKAQPSALSYVSAVWQINCFLQDCTFSFLSLKKTCRSEQISKISQSWGISVGTVKANTVQLREK